MTKDAIDANLKVTPFVPFTITTNDGKSYEVEHPENVVFPYDREIVILVGSAIPSHAILALSTITHLDLVAEK